MRMTASTSPVRKGRQSLLGSCAIAAGLAALAIGGPALAQVAGSGTGAGATISPPAPGAPPNTTTVTTTTAQTVITWTPSDDVPTGAPIDFLPAGNTLEFYGTGQYVVLNRFTNSGGGSISRQIALNGTVNSFVTTPGLPNVQGGNIWFYNAGGILIGATANINVGSLVLTANDIDTTGGFFGPDGEIRFRGASGSLSSVEIAAGARVNASNADPGSSYLALVAPRIVQNGIVTVDGSTAYVAAEQADITINNGLFDINVLVGAEGGTVIDHGGTTTGPAHQQGDTDQNRIYMVAIPKNNAVTMLVSGPIGYQEAVVAQVDPDGAIRLSAGYNITGGEIDASPTNAAPANITINDSIFDNSVTAHASGALVGAPLQTISTPPYFGNLFVEGDALFIGDASAALSVGAGQLVGATGNLIVQSGGVGAAPGNASVTATGGQLTAGGGLGVDATGVLQPDGSALGGTASLSITGGTVSVGATVQVFAPGTGGIGDDGVTAGDGTGGDATILVSGVGSSLTANAILLDAGGLGGGLIVDGNGGVTAVDIGGDGFGGNATVSVADGGSLTANQALFVNASGTGRTGNVQSGSGTGGTARVDLSGTGSSIASSLTLISAVATGGGTFVPSSSPVILTQSAGDAVGGVAELILNGDSSASALLGATLIGAGAIGGEAGGGGDVGGNATGGNVTVAVDGGMLAEFDQLNAAAAAISGGTSDPTAIGSVSGNAQGGTVTVAAANGSALNSETDILLDASASSGDADNLGNVAAGDISATATTGGQISALGGFTAVAEAENGTAPVTSAGSATGGDIDLTANGGGIAADSYFLDAGAQRAQADVAGGDAAGGTIDLLASGGGAIAATDPGAGNDFVADAQTGRTPGGSTSTGGTIQMIADGGTIDMAAALQLSAGGTAGGDSTPGAQPLETGIGGTVLVRLRDNGADAGAMTFTTIVAEATGTALGVGEGGITNGVAGATGGTMTFDIQGGSFTATDVTVNADGSGGGGPGIGRGGTAIFTQTGGDIDVTTLSVSASGFGGFAPDVSGTGIGGTATINLNGGTLTATEIAAGAIGVGGSGGFGNDDPPPFGRPAGAGGSGQGGSATINMSGTAVVDTGRLVADATGVGGDGGSFSSFSGIADDGGDGGSGTGGTATINIVSGTLNTGDLIADSGGTGGQGGSFFNSGSSGSIIGVGVGGTGGTGSGGTSTIALQTDVTATGAVTSMATGTGGTGGQGMVGGNGGDALGGLAQAVITGFDAGSLDGTIDASAQGGNGADGSEGEGGDGGNAVGGTARAQAEGAGADFSVDQDNFISTGTGGNGGAGGIFLSGSLAGPAGGDGGDGTGGTLEIAANDGATIGIGIDTLGPVPLQSGGIGGDGGSGASNGFTPGFVGGDGGVGGSGSGGSVVLRASGGTLTSNTASVDIAVSGAAGNGGSGGTALGGNGAAGGALGTAGGNVVIDAAAGTAGAGQIDFGATTIAANGDTAGRIVLQTSGGSGITLASLGAEVLGFADPTNNDVDTSPAGIFLAPNGGTIATVGAMNLSTDSSIGIYAQGAGQVNAGSDLVIQAADQVDIRHGLRGESSAPTVQAGGSLQVLAANGISGAPGTLLSAGTFLGVGALGGSIAVDSLSSGGATILIAQNGDIGVGGTATSGTDLSAQASGAVAIAEANAGDDINLGGTSLAVGRLTATGTGLDSEGDGSNIVMDTGGDATVDHAEAGNDFTATVGSFATGLNSIITGGDINIVAPGAVDLGNSSAGGFVQVSGQSIAFNTIVAGTTVGLNATGTAAGAEGISGVDITAGDAIDLNADAIAITGTVLGGANLFAFADDGDVGIANAAIDGSITISAIGNITGSYDAGGDVVLIADGDIDAAANALGTYVNPNGGPTEGLVFADADGDATLTNSSAATMFGVRAGQGATVGNASAGEDMLVLAGTTATLTNASAGDDLTVDADGGITANGVATTGTGPDTRMLSYGPFGSPGFNFFSIAASAPDQSNIDLDSAAGNIVGGDIGAFGNLTATAAGSVTTTGLLGSGGFTIIRGSSLSLAAIAAGTDIRLFSTSGDISSTGTLAAGDNVTIGAAANVDVAQIDAGGEIDVDAGGAANVNNAIAGELIVVAATSDIGGNYTSGGDVRLTAGGDIAASAVANGGALDSDGIAYEGNLFVDAAGNATLTNSSAARMFGVHADGSASLSGVAAGEDMLVLAGTTATLTNASAGDDLTVDAGSDIAATNVAASGSGADTAQLGYSGTAFSITGGSGAAASEGADIVLTSGGAVDATGLSAGDDIVLTAATTLAVDGAATLGLGTTGGDSSIRIQSGNASLGSLDAFDDIIVDSTGAVSITATSSAGRNIALTAASLTLADLATPAGAPLDTLNAGGDLTITTSGSTSGGAIRAGGDIGVAAGNAAIATIAAAGNVALAGDAGLAVGALASGGTTDLVSGNGAIIVSGLSSAGPVSASGNAVAITGNNSLAFAALATDVGDAVVQAGGNLSIADGNVAGLADLGAGNDLDVDGLTANAIRLDAGNELAMTDVTAATSLIANALGTATIDGTVTGADIAITSGDIAIASAGRVAATGGLQISNGNADVQTFVGGTGSRAGYHIDSDELTRIFGNDIGVFAPDVDDVGGGSVGSSAPPDVVIDDFTLTAGGQAPNLGAGGSMTIETPGKARVVGDVQLTGLSDDNALTIRANDALEVILGEGSIRLTGSDSTTPAGLLSLRSADVIVATMDAIADVGAATSVDAIDARLAQNDGVVIDDGALFAGGIDVRVGQGFYVQNSGEGIDFDQRRGLTFGALGLYVGSGGPIRVVINGVQLTASGQITGLDTIPLLEVGGSAVDELDPRSTFNGCLIANPASCGAPPPQPEPEFETDFAVRDTIEEGADPDEAGDGNNLPTALITMRELDPLTGEPLLDDPVTGAGNDDLWTPSFDDKQGGQKEADQKKTDQKDATEKPKGADKDKMSPDLAKLLEKKMADKLGRKPGAPGDKKDLADAVKDVLGDKPTGDDPKSGDKAKTELENLVTKLAGEKKLIPGFDGLSKAEKLARVRQLLDQAPDDAKRAALIGAIEKEMDKKDAPPVDKNR